MIAPKRQLNIRFLTWLLVPLLLLAIGSGILWSLQSRRISESLKNRALAAAEEDRPQDAISLLQRYLAYEKNPADDALSRYGFLLDKYGETTRMRQRAIPALEKALIKETDPATIRKIYTSLANILLDDEKFTDARKHLDWLTKPENQPTVPRESPEADAKTKPKRTKPRCSSSSAVRFRVKANTKTPSNATSTPSNSIPPRSTPISSSLGS